MERNAVISTGDPLFNIGSIRKPESSASELADEQHRPAAIAVAGPGGKRCSRRHEDDRDAQHAEELRAGDLQRGDAIGEREHRGDVEQRVAHHHQQCARNDGLGVVREQLHQWNLISRSC